MSAETFIGELARMQKNKDFAVTANDIHSEPLKYQELRQRLKHIASLCWGLSIDLQNEIEYRETLEKAYNRMRKAVTELYEQMSTYPGAFSEQVKFCKHELKKILYPNGCGAYAPSTAELTPEDMTARAEQRARVRACANNRNKETKPQAKAKPKQTRPKETAEEKAARIAAMTPEERERYENRRAGALKARAAFMAKHSK